MARTTTTTPPITSNRTARAITALRMSRTFAPWRPVVKTRYRVVMQIGIMLEGQEGLNWERWVRISQQVDGLGLDSLWRSAHFLSVTAAADAASLQTW